MVTGGAGFIGSHVADALLEAGADVTVLDDLSAGRLENVPRSARFVRADVNDVGDVLDASFDHAFHFAANASVPTSVEDPRRDFRTNAAGTLALLEYARRHDVGRVVYASTAAVYGEPAFVPITEEHPLSPVSPYGASKLAGERTGYAYASTYGVRFSAVRIFNTYGPRQPRYVMYDLIRKLQANPRRLEVLGTGEQVRDYCFATDMASAFLRVGRVGGGPYNAAGGNPVSIREIAERIASLVAPDARIHYGGKTWPGDITRLVASVDRLRAIGFAPRVGIDEGLRRLHESMREPEAAVAH